MNVVMACTVHSIQLDSCFFTFHSFYLNVNNLRNMLIHSLNVSPTCLVLHFVEFMCHRLTVSTSCCISAYVLHKPNNALSPNQLGLGYTAQSKSK